MGRKEKINILFFPTTSRKGSSRGIIHLPEETFQRMKKEDAASRRLHAASATGQLTCGRRAEQARRKPTQGNVCGLQALPDDEAIIIYEALPNV